jgi:TonB family protein
MPQTTWRNTAMVIIMLMTLVTPNARGRNGAPTQSTENPKLGAPPSGETTVSMPSDSAEILAAASIANGLAGTDLRPWHIKATYQTFDSGKPTGSGTYEEFWASDKKYRRTYASPTFTQTEYGTDRGLFRSGNQEWPGRTETELRLFLTAPIPEAMGLRHMKVKMKTVSMGTAHFQCVTVQAKDLVPLWSAYCFEPDRPAVRFMISRDGLSQVLYNTLVIFQGHFVARDIRVTYKDEPILTLHVDEIGQAPGSADAQFTPSADAVGPLTGKIVVRGETMSVFEAAQSLPEYPTTAKEAGVEGTVVVRTTIGKDGLVTNAEAISGPPLLLKSAAEAVSKWEFRPFVVMGEPTEIETDLKVIFQLRD